MIELRVAKVDERAILPTRNHPEDAGIDFYCYGRYTVYAGSDSLINTGITVEIPEGFVGILKPKGRSNFLVGSGVVDAGYQGEIIVRIVNPYSYKIEFMKGDPLCQMILIPVVTPAIKELDRLEIHKNKSQRSASGGIHSSTLNSEVVGLSDNQPKLPYGKGWD
jgi:dUTP pyrophosphatase